MLGCNKKEINHLSSHSFIHSSFTPPTAIMSRDQP
jgi:hypothetical protein